MGPRLLTPSSDRADAIVRTIRGIPEAELRVSYVKTLLRTGDLPTLAAALDVVCGRAQQAEPAAREVLVALVDSVQDPTLVGIVGRLREEAGRVPHLALERLLRQAPAHVALREGSPSVAPKRLLVDPEDDRIPDYGRGRPLTLGERKALARRPTREMTERLLRDPHPDVIRRLLGNPKVTEDDVLALASRRPCRSDVLSEIARIPRWMHRPRIRIALLLNPDTPLEVSAPLVGLLVRQELHLVASSPKVAPVIRALCLEHLERRPPTRFDDDDGSLLQ